MKKVLIALFVLSACTSKSEIQESNNVDPKMLFDRSLILGASISANYNGVTSPGEKLAQRFESGNQVDKIARNGARSSEILAQLKSKNIQDYSSLVGVDLFFWDSAEIGCGVATENIRELTNLVKGSTTKLFLGSVPRLPRVPLQPCMNAINDALQENCKTDQNCFIVPLKATYEKLDSDGKIEFQSQFYNKDQLIPDGLHLTPVGSELVADEILGSVSAN